MTAQETRTDFSIILFYGPSPKVVDDIHKNILLLYKLIGVEAGRLLGD
jgi:hypothetical protein